jgi:hypothetical protein
VAPVVKLLLCKCKALNSNQVPPKQKKEREERGHYLRRGSGAVGGRTGDKRDDCYQNTLYACMKMP